MYQARHEGVPFSHGFSLSLNHWRDDSSDDSINQQIIHIRGNVLEERIWHALDVSMRDHGVPKFGMILWAPAGGLHPEYVTDSLEVYQEILKRLWERMSKQNGMLLAEIPAYIKNDHAAEYTDWKQKLLDWQRQHVTLRRGLYQFDGADTVMRLEKTPLNVQLPSFTN